MIEGQGVQPGTDQVPKRIGDVGEVDLVDIQLWRVGGADKIVHYHAPLAQHHIQVVADELPVGLLHVPALLGQVHVALSGQLHGKVVFSRQLHHRLSHFGGNVVAPQQLSGGNAANLAAVAQNAQVFPCRSRLHRRREEKVLPSGGGHDGHPFGVGLRQSLVETGGKAQVVGLQGRAVQIHGEKLNIHWLNLLTTGKGRW